MDEQKKLENFFIVNQEIVFLKEEKERRATELKLAYNEIAFHIEERGKRAAELAVANLELKFQNEEKEKRAEELLIANQELAFQNCEKEKRAKELLIANQELAFQNSEKEKRAEELSIAISELQKAEADVRKLNAELEKKVIKRSAQYAFLSQVNQTIVHVKDAETLFRKSCSIALEFGRYKMAWIGSFDSSQNTTTLLDSSGISKQDIELFSDVPYLTNTTDEYQFRTGKYFLCNDIGHSLELESWIPHAERLKIGSCIILPIMKSGSLFGTFNLYATEQNFFDDEDIELALEVAGDISFALDLFEKADRQKEAELELQKNFAELEAVSKVQSAILNTLPASIALLNNAGNIVKVNDEWIHFGKTNGLHDSYQHLNKNYIEISENSSGSDEEEGKQMSQGLKEILGGSRDYFTMEYPCNSPTENRWFKAEVKPIKSNLLAGAVVMHINISERKKGELERLNITNALLQRNRDLEQFTSIISHNLRAPIANIMGLTEILQDENITPEERNFTLRGLSSCALGLDSVIRDINSIIQVKYEINDKKETVIFSESVNEIIKSISNTMEKYDVSIKTDFSEVDEIFSLKLYMQSIFYNLISNSIKYRKQEDKPLIEITSKKANEKIILTFKDNGLGFDSMNSGDKVFKIYNRFHSHVEGKGLGLFMVKTQVEAIGGNITVTSELDKGTEFKIILKTE